jgi:N-formylglutamate amidohydrolase
VAPPPPGVLILHVPHASTAVPPDVRRRLLLDDAQLADELRLMTDSYVDELFALPADEAVTIIYPVSRLVCDPERFEDDAREPMSRIGMGVIYTATHDGRRCGLRQTPREAEREGLLDRFYRPHHARLTVAVEAELRDRGHCLIVDAHSFPSLPLPYELDQARERPDICLGTDDVHTPPSLLRAAEAAFSARFVGVAHNRPFAGALVPAAFLNRDHRVSSIMVEVNRGLYMDEGTGDRLPGFATVACLVQEAVRELVDVA